jgi:hypothetical protein
MLQQTFSEINVLYRDEFDYIMDGLAPENWETSEEYSLRETKDSEFKINGIQDPGMVFYYPAEVINPGEGVYFTFKFMGTEAEFTLGFDNFQANGELIPYGGENFHSVAFLLGDTPSTHAIRNNVQSDEVFNGNLELQEGNWYHFAMGFTDEGDYLIKIWDPTVLQSPLVYMANWPGFPDEYYFISWVSNQRTLWMDNFTIFEFDSITQTGSSDPDPGPSPTLTAVPLPSSFSTYESSEDTADLRFTTPNFSLQYPTGWTTGWLQDSGVTAFLVMGDPNAWQVPEGLWLMVIPIERLADDISVYSNDFSRGTIIEGPTETIVNGNKRTLVVSNDSEVIQISVLIESDDPTEGVFVTALLPYSGEELYRPLIEQIINSIEVYSKIPDAVITSDPLMGPIPTTYLFTLSEFQPNETIYIKIYYKQSLSMIYETTLTADELGNASFEVTSEPSDNTGAYLIIAEGESGSYGETIVFIQ